MKSAIASSVVAPLVAFAVCAAPSQSFADPAKSVYEETIEQTFPLNADGGFNLGNRNGRVELTAWDKNEIHVVAEKRMRLDEGGWWLGRLIGLKQVSVDSDTEARDLFKSLSVEFKGDEKFREIVTHYPDAQNVNFQVSYRISAPRGAKIQIKTVNGSIQVDGMRNGAQLETTSGAVSVSDVRGAIEVETTNGRVRLDDVSGAISAGATNGSITAQLLSGAKLEDVKLRSVNGSVRLVVSSTAGFDLQARTVNGSVNCDLPFASVKEQSRKRIDAVVGVPGGHVQMSTTNGSVSVSSQG